MEDKVKEKQNVISVRCTPDYYVKVKDLQVKGGYRSVPELVNALLRAEMKRLEQPATDNTAGSEVVA